MLNCEMLSGLKVLEWAEGASAPYCTRVMADLGAEVIKIESPHGGDVARQRGPFSPKVGHPGEGGLFLLLNANKRGITLDVSRADGRDLFRRLVEKVDCLVEDRPPGHLEELELGPDDLLEINPRLVITSITPFGRTGPYAHYKAYPLNVFHAGGSGYILPSDEAHPERPPIKTWRHAGEMECGLIAAVAALAAVFHAAATGQGQHIDVSKQEALMNLERMDLGRYPNGGTLLSRTKNTFRVGGRFRCSDGYVVVIPVQSHHWDGLVQLLGKPDWASHEMCRDEFTRAEHAEVIHGKIAEHFATMPKEELYHRGQAFGVPISPVYDVSELLRSQQLRQRKFFLPVEHPVLGPLEIPSLPYVFREGARMVFSPAPRLGQDNEAVFGEYLTQRRDDPPRAEKEGNQHAGGEPPRLDHKESGPSAAPPGRWESDGAPKALAGVRILDFTWAWAGPHATYLLASMGAEVIKVESRSRPDHTRMRSLAAGRTFRGIDEAPWFHDMNPNKLSLSIDLRKPEAAGLLMRVARHCDVVTENFRPGVMQRLGLGYEAFREARPDIIMASSSLNGEEGPEKNYVGYAPNFSTLGGMTGLTGRPGEPPSTIGGRSDLLSGVYLAYAVVAALHHRQRTGKGAYIDMSSSEAVGCTAAEAFLEYALTGRVPAPEGNADEWMAPHNCYPCRGEDQWISIAVGSDSEWEALCGAMGRPGWAREARFQTAEGRYRHRDELDHLIGRWTRGWDRDELVGRLQESGVAAFGSMSNQDLWEDPHVQSRGMWVRLRPPNMEERAMLAPPYHFSKTPARIETPAPLMGQHNRYVLGEIAGFSGAEIEELEGRGVLH